MSETDGSRLIELDGSNAVQNWEKQQRPGLPEDYQTREQSAREAAAQGGILFPNTRVPAGEALWDSGEAVLKADRAAWAARPHFREGVEIVQAALRAEDRRDWRVPVNALRLDPVTARLQTKPGSAGAGYSDHSFRQLVAQAGYSGAPRGFASSLAYLYPADRASALNRQLVRAEATPVTLRTRLASDGTRVVRAVLSERYGSINDLDIAAALAQAYAGSEADGRLDYKPGDRHSRFEVIFPSQVPVKTFRTGDIHYAVIGFENSETGEGSFTGYAGLMRAACYNLTLAWGQGTEIKIRHIGDAVSRMRGAVNALAHQIEPLVAAIQESATVEAPGNVFDLFGKIAAKFDAGEARAEAWADTYRAKYSDSPTLWGVTSAITDAAQGLSYWREQAAEEQIASQLVTVQCRALN